MKRRSFIKQSAKATAVFTIVPSYVLGKKHTAPSDTLYMAAIGVGGRGAGVLDELYQSKRVKYVALCDVDAERAASTYKKHPKAKTYKDFRNLYDEHIDEIDAVMVATPDHTHAVIALPFMRAKKHAYVEKPLTHNIHEARLMTEVATQEEIITQMGNQGASSNDIRTAKLWIEKGLIGKVHKVDCWTNRPVWPQGMTSITKAEPIPNTLSWDLWLGPASYRDYNSAYLPFKWRAFWDFGTGALGDMGCHIMETPFNVLDLGYPTQAEASCTTVWADDFVEADYPNLCPPSSIVRLRFETEKHGTCQLNWYDGGLMPELPEELKNGEHPGDWNGGSIFYGERGIMITDTYSRNPRLLPNEVHALFNAPTHEDKTRTDESSRHAIEFVDACLDGTETSSPFSYAGPLTEAVLMGNLAIRAHQHKVLKEGKTAADWAPYEYPGRRKLHWDGDNMRITNYEEANIWVSREYREGWKLQ